MAKVYRSFGALARAMRANAARLPTTYSEWCAGTADVVKLDAKERIGHYQHGWAPLALSTVADKGRKGFLGALAVGGDGGENPLLRTGRMRGTIQSEVTTHGFIVGSEDEVMKWQEFGTSKMPPRPVLGPAMYRVMPLAAPLLARNIGRTVGGE